MNVVLNASSARSLSLPSYLLICDYTMVFDAKPLLVLDIRRNPFFFPSKCYHHLPYYRVFTEIGNQASKFVATAVTTVASAYALANISKDRLALLQAATLPLSLFSKLPQIRQNTRSKINCPVSQMSCETVYDVHGTQRPTRRNRLRTRPRPQCFSRDPTILLRSFIESRRQYSQWRENRRRVELQELRELGNGSGRPGATQVAPVTATGREGASPALYEPAPSRLEAPVTQSPIQRSSTPIQRAATPSGGGSGGRVARLIDVLFYL
jgi:hypothetical protein